MKKALTTAEENRGPNLRLRPLKESQYLDIMQEACMQKWGEYGVKEINGSNKLVGPGLAADNGMGLVVGGGRWNDRLIDKCLSAVGEVGEDELYELHRSPGGIVPVDVCATFVKGGFCSFLARISF